MQYYSTLLLLAFNSAQQYGYINMCDLAILRTFKMSGLYDIIKDGYYIKRIVKIIGMSFINCDKYLPASMKGDVVSDASATYALLDFAKKTKNKRVCVPEDVQESDSANPLYAVVEKTKTPIAAPEKSLEYTHDSADLANNETSMYEEPVPSSTSYLSLELSQQEKDKSKSEGSARARRLVCWGLLVVVALVLVVAVIACLVFTFVVVSPLKSEIKSLQQHTANKLDFYEKK